MFWFFLFSFYKRIRYPPFSFCWYLSSVVPCHRCPHLRRLVLPAWNRIKKTGMCKAIRGWKDLESLTMPSIASPSYLLEEIAANCRNFRELKIMGPCDVNFASCLATYVPKLRVLSLRCSTLFKDALILILDNLQHLEVLNISHCVLMEALPPPHQKRIMKELDQSIRQKASRLRRFFACMEDSCIMCQRTRTDEGLVRWYKYEEGLWKTDEIRSLSLWVLRNTLSGGNTSEFRYCCLCYLFSLIFDLCYF